MLTTELSIIFAAFNCTAWSEARRIVNSLSHLLSVSKIARTCNYEAWTTRAVLCNLFTHVHRDLRDEVLCSHRGIWVIYRGRFRCSPTQTEIPLQIGRCNIHKRPYVGAFCYSLATRRA